MSVTLRAAHDSEAEKQTIEIILDALHQHPDLDRYMFSPDAIVDETVQPPHSHPVITLNTRDNNSPELVLSNFVHEQLHHFLQARDPELERAVEELKQIYPNVPVGFPDGANSEFWTYGHLILCTIEYKILRRVFGSEYANLSLKHWQGHHYRWIYKTVESDFAQLLEIATKYKLAP